MAAVDGACGVGGGGGFAAGRRGESPGSRGAVGRIGVAVCSQSALLEIRGRRRMMGWLVDAKLVTCWPRRGVAFCELRRASLRLGRSRRWPAGPSAGAGSCDGPAGGPRVEFVRVMRYLRACSACADPLYLAPAVAPPRDLQAQGARFPASRPLDSGRRFRSLAAATPRSFPNIQK